MRSIFFVSLIALLGASLTGCSLGSGKPDTEGIILEANENGVLLAQNLSADEYENIKDKSVDEIQNEDESESADPDLMDVIYEDADQFSKGDEVDVWIDGDIFDSDPPQADAKKISKKN